MQISLSRIEREYILSNLNSDLPTLSLLINNELITINHKAYSIANEKILFENSDSACRFVKDTPVRVFFRHKQRGFVFQSQLEKDKPDSFVIEISHEIFKDDPQLGSDITGRVKITVDSNSFDAFSQSLFPLDSIVVDPELCLSRIAAITKLAHKVNITEVGSLLSYRLFEYLDGFSQKGTIELDPHASHFIFIDHENILVSIQHTDRNPLSVGSSVKLIIGYGKRHIRATALIQGFVPINAQLTVVNLKIDAQEEDKRFLYEKLYREKYQK